ncbi:monothiol bacilliredoxin BrxC family protein [Neolewinella antarctica]|uniref:Bacillithiol system protein YtxJ n=1 Tax=Neolewinella antarctica TaxID=442734 RepID=A0ABX0X9W2_9BACT|nr:monothiol bacilliredoxin BrxC family protein [Neolewinella antarctica]NJC25724.1 bacillithiol system protein YtxJ [Neolewinella antarctica]
MFNVMKTSADFQAALDASQEKPIVIFKHSATCPFSAAAQIEVANTKHDLDIYGITLQYTPELKVEIAEKLGVEHKSPQTIVVHKGKAVSSQWRGDIQERVLKNAVKDLA